MTTGNTLRRLFSYAKPYRRRLGWAVVAMLFYAAGSAGLAYLVKPIFDQALPSQTGVAAIATAIIAVYFIKGIGSYGSSYLMADVGQRVVMDLRNALYRHILGQSAGFFAHGATGRLLSRINNDVSQVQQAVSETAGDLARETLSLVGFAALMVWIDPRLAIVCMTGAPLVVHPLIQLGQRVRRTTRRSQEALEQISHLSSETFTGHRIVKAFGTEAQESERFARAGYHLFRTNMKVTAAMATLPPLMELLGGVGMAGALWYGVNQIAAGRLTSGQFVAFFTAVFMMYGPAKKLSRVNANLQQAMAAAERIFELLDTHTEVMELPGAAELPPFHDRIEFHDVGFEYEQGAVRILRRVTFTVRAGQMIAIVGRSGSGKTTLVNLLPRFYDVSAGAIFIDGVDIRHVTLPSLRNQIGFVTQETVLFDDTIASNVAYGSPRATREQIEAAARAANAHEFIAELPQGYDTTIGERGQRLSGGQRQRLAIARALLKNAPILVLDEATSALDTESELLVQEALANLMLNRTSFVIAHRLSTIRRADAIIVLDHGRIVELGRHDELIANPEGTYATLYQLQVLETRDAQQRLRPHRVEDMERSGVMGPRAGRPGERPRSEQQGEVSAIARGGGGAPPPVKKR
jgi:subfamily B ATP-binding cassette protein MsbA